MNQRKIIHIDMDAFFASVEQRDNPDLRGKPVCVGGSKERGVVAAASYEARKFGVHSAMSSRIAYQKCPEIIFVKPRFEIYKKVSLQIRSIFKRYSDVVEPLSLDEAFIDVTENKQGISTATEIAGRIKQEIKEELNLIASAGVSVNKFLAKVASDQNKPDGLFVLPPSKVDEFIAHLEISKFFGIGKVTAEKMHRLGVYFGKDLQRIPLEVLKENFKSNGEYYYNICRGIDLRIVNPHRERKSVGCERTYDVNIQSKKEIHQELTKIVDILIERLEKTSLRNRTITLKIKFSDFTQITRSKTVDYEIRSKEKINELSRSIVNVLEDNLKEIRLIGLTLSNPVIDKKLNYSQLTLDL